MVKKSKSKSKSKKTSPWIAHCKAFAKKHGLTYPQALSHPDCKATYKSVAKPASKPAKKTKKRKHSNKKKTKKMRKMRGGAHNVGDKVQVKRKQLEDTAQGLSGVFMGVQGTITSINEGIATILTSETHTKLEVALENLKPVTLNINPDTIEGSEEGSEGSEV
jgi:hypothetical protein